MQRNLTLILSVCSAAVFGVASAVLAVSGSSLLQDHPRFAIALGAVMGIGVAGPPMVRLFSQRARLSALASQDYLRWRADGLREQIIESDVGFELRDVGVHIFLKKRSPLLFFRAEYVRYARSAHTTRSPEPGHAVWRENWLTGLAPGLVGIVAERDDAIRVNLMDTDHLQASPTVWDAWFADRDERALGVDWAAAAKPRAWFSAIWAEPIPSRSGHLLGVITVNTEQRRSDGHSMLEAAGTRTLLHEAAREIGYRLTTE